MAITLSFGPSVIASEVVDGILFNLCYSYTLISFLSVLLVVYYFWLFHKKIIQSINATFSSASQNLAMRNIVNRNRDGLSRRFNDLGEVFCEMDRVFRSMIKGGLTLEEAKLLLKSEVKEKIFRFIVLIQEVN